MAGEESKVMQGRASLWQDWTGVQRIAGARTGRNGT